MGWFWVHVTGRTFVEGVALGEFRGLFLSFSVQSFSCGFASSLSSLFSGVLEVVEFVWLFVLGVVVVDVSSDFFGHERLDWSGVDFDVSLEITPVQYLLLTPSGSRRG